MKQVSDDSNFGNARDTSGLIDATPNSKEFGFCGQNIHSMMDRLGDSFVMNMNMSDGGGNVVFDTDIGNHKSMRRM